MKWFFSDVPLVNGDRILHWKVYCILAKNHTSLARIRVTVSFLGIFNKLMLVSFLLQPRYATIRELLVSPSVMSAMGTIPHVTLCACKEVIRLDTVLLNCNF